MGQTRRHFGRENGDDAKFHRWWRKNENVICRKDHDRTKIADLATATILNEKVSLKTRNTAIPKSKDMVSATTRLTFTTMKSMILITLQTQLTLSDGGKI